MHYLWVLCSKYKYSIEMFTIHCIIYNLSVHYWLQMKMSLTHTHCTAWYKNTKTTKWNNSRVNYKILNLLFSKRFKYFFCKRIVFFTFALQIILFYFHLLYSIRNIVCKLLFWWNNDKHWKFLPLLPLLLFRLLHFSLLHFVHYS